MNAGGDNDTLIDKPFKFPADLPGPLKMGRGVLGELNSILDKIGDFSKVLVIADPVTCELAGGKVASSLGQTNMELFSITSASVEEVMRAESVLNGGGFDLVIGLGGGRPIDVAKLTAYRRGLPFVSIPTSPSHDGIASGRASLVHLGTVTSILARPPVAVIADLDILLAAPARLTASGCADILSNLTAVLDWDLANSVTGEPIHEEAYTLSKKAGEMVASFDGPVAADDTMKELMRTNIF